MYYKKYFILFYICWWSENKCQFCLGFNLEKKCPYKSSAFPQEVLNNENGYINLVVMKYVYMTLLHLILCNILVAHTLKWLKM